MKNDPTYSYIDKDIFAGVSNKDLWEKKNGRNEKSIKFTQLL